MSNLVQQSGIFATERPTHVREILANAERELKGLMQKRAEIMKRIGTIKQLVAGLSDLYGDAVLSDELRCVLARKVSERNVGFTKGCRQILMEATSPLTLRQCCTELWRRAPELAGRHKDLAASVTTVLRRIVTYGEAHTFLDQKGVRVWNWVSEPHGDDCHGDDGKDRLEACDARANMVAEA
ncbi:MAG TPA: hypothetical protein VFO39_08895 [Candidatus Sulfotelmatobacter sp.]|nr:hypothetical protein [Candidatus Sulfotelmatobacter sp.]